MSLKENMFSDFKISDEILNGLKKMNFNNPTNVQNKCIPILMDKKDIIVQAHTGTGKTAAFGVPILENIDVNNNNVQSIVLCPTRELAQQVSVQLEEIAAFINKLKITALVGGLSIENQIRKLKKNTHIVVGTPGRIVDHIKRKTLKLESINFIVLDEADEMLDMGFKEDLNLIFKKISSKHQTALFSATIPKSIQKLAQNYQRNPINIKVNMDNSITNKIKQYYYAVPSSKKLELLMNLLDIKNPSLSIVFCNTKRRVDALSKHLEEEGYSVKTLHGDIEQKKRDHVMKSFRDGLCRILIATDVAARGIDVRGIEAVFNFDLPIDYEGYTHRIGRTGRADMSGNSYSFASHCDYRLINKIKKLTLNKIIECPFPKNQEAEKAKINLFFNSIDNIINVNSLSKYENLIKSYLSKNENNSVAKLAAALLSMNLKNRNTNVSFSDNNSDNTRYNNKRKSKTSYRGKFFKSNKKSYKN